MIATLIATIIALIAYNPAPGVLITPATAVCRQAEVAPNVFVVALTTPPLSEDAYGEGLSTFDSFGTYNIVGFVSQDPDESCRTMFSYKW